MKKIISVMMGCCVFMGVYASSSLKSISAEAMDWDVPSLYLWNWDSGVMKNFSSGEYAYHRETPYAEDFTAELNIKPLEVRSKSRNEAAIALVSADQDDVWRLALVEHNGKRFADLKVYYRKNKSDCNMTKSMVQVTCLTGKDFQWEFSQEYRLRLHGEPGKATGEIYSKDGMLLYKVVGELNSGKKLKPVSFAVFCTALCSEFSKPKAAWKNAVPRPVPGKALRKPQYSSPRNAWNGVEANATGYFYVKQSKNGRWHLIDPLGKEFFACGIDRLYMDGRFCEALGYSPYLRNVQKKFGTRENWVKHTMIRISDWGFNYASTADDEFYDCLPFSANLAIGSTFAAFGDSYNICPYLGRVGTALPNPFHPRFEEWAKRSYDNWIGSEKENPYLLGFFCDNELRWRGEKFNADGSGVFDTVLKKKMDHTAKQALVIFLKKRFNNDIKVFNSFWGTNLKDFDALNSLCTLPHQKQEQLDVKLDFLSLTADTYYGRIRKALREVDPNHMLLGNRFAGIASAPDRVWESAGKYCDIVTFNQYPIVDFEQNRLWMREHQLIKEFDRIAKLCKRPLMITEWSFMGLDSGLPCSTGAGQRCRTQVERAKAAELFVRTVLAMPYMLGMSWYQYTDDPKLGVRITHPESCNYGLVSEDDTPYAELVSMFSKIQKNIPETRKEGFPVSVPLNYAGVLYAGFNSPLLAANAEPGLESLGNATSPRFTNGSMEIRIRGERGTIGLFLNGQEYGALQLMAKCDNNRKPFWPKANKIVLKKVERRTAGIVLEYTSFFKRAQYSFEVDSRLLLPVRGNWIMVDLTAVRNTGDAKLDLTELIFQSPCTFSVEVAPSPAPTDYYFVKNDVWKEAGDSGRYLGAMASISHIKFHFYRDPKNVLQPGGHHLINQNIAPDGKWEIMYPCYAFFFCGSAGNFKQVVQSLHDQDLASPLRKQSK